jgi:hypothetical protein
MRSPVPALRFGTLRVVGARVAATRVAPGVAGAAVESALTRIAGACSSRISVVTGASAFAPGQRSNATTAETTASIKRDAASNTPVVPRLAI